MKSGLVVSILGGGSAYTPGLIEGFVRLRDKLPVERFILMDIDGRKLRIVGDLVARIAEDGLPGTKVETTESREEALKGADFVLCQIRVGGLDGRHLDESIPAEMGLVGQETVGAGGFAMALRTIPVMVQIARDLEHLCPNAWLVNYTNPTGMVAEALHRTSSGKHIAICDEPMILQESVAAVVGAPASSIFLDYFGLNHLGFARKVYCRGVDILPDLRQKLKTVPREYVESLFSGEVLKDPKTRQEITNTLRILDETGLLPSPYLQYYYFTDEIVRRQRESKKTRAQEVMEIERDLLREYEQVSRGVKALEARRGGKWHADMMLGVLAAIANDERRLYIVNVPNHGSLPELPYGKTVEVPAVVDAAGAHPLAMGNMPPQVRGLIQAVAAYEELAVEAALTGSREAAIEALSCHPLVSSRDLAKRLFDSYLAAHRAYLPQFAGDPAGR